MNQFHFQISTACAAKTFFGLLSFTAAPWPHAILAHHGIRHFWWGHCPLLGDGGRASRRRFGLLWHSGKWINEEDWDYARDDSHTFLMPVKCGTNSSREQYVSGMIAWSVAKNVYSWPSFKIFQEFASIAHGIRLVSFFFRAPLNYFVLRTVFQHLADDFLSFIRTTVRPRCSGFGYRTCIFI